jgi:hypothetical protein
LPDIAGTRDSQDRLVIDSVISGGGGVGVVSGRLDFTAIRPFEVVTQLTGRIRFIIVQGHLSGASSNSPSEKADEKDIGEHTTVLSSVDLVCSL